MDFLKLSFEKRRKESKMEEKELEGQRVFLLISSFAAFNIIPIAFRFSQVLTSVLGDY